MNLTMMTINNDTFRNYNSQMPGEAKYVSVIVSTKRIQEAIGRIDQ